MSNRIYRLNIPVTKEEKKTIKKDAVNEGKTLSTYCRDILYKKSKEVK